ncbi:ribosome biogenesis GTPase YlqF [Pseudogracilibacillus sp. ICA-222130]|uniref:ribosome biogenesis GTPase YlqF n=1 Tax=Pseudogracilibacillus sp. ICA-222130 TaxID=3134655 RepID=UPI0030BCF882
MIQWFPGHMAKARREIEAKLKLVDVVIELVDARAPQSTQNPMLQEVIGQKEKIIVLMKKDLADAIQTDKWLQYFEAQDKTAMALDVNNKKDIQQFIELVTEKGIEKQRKLIEKGVQQRAVRALIVGIPNVGKSTLINRLANKKIAKIGDRPGVTKQQQWIKVKQKFELLDTPGILWPKFDDEQIGLRVAAIGSIKDEILPLQDVAAFLLQYIYEDYPNLLEERYGLTNVDDMWEVFEEIGKKRGALESGGQVNFDKVADVVLQDFRQAKLGKITLETP